MPSRISARWLVPFMIAGATQGILAIGSMFYCHFLISIWQLILALSVVIFVCVAGLNCLELGVRRPTAIPQSDSDDEDKEPEHGKLELRCVNCQSQRLTTAATTPNNTED